MFNKCKYCGERFLTEKRMKKHLMLDCKAYIRFLRADLARRSAEREIKMKMSLLSPPRPSRHHSTYKHSTSSNHHHHHHCHCDHDDDSIIPMPVVVEQFRHVEVEQQGGSFGGGGASSSWSDDSSSSNND